MKKRGEKRKKKKNSKKQYKNPLKNKNKFLHPRNLTFGQRATDTLTKFAGSWMFIIGLLCLVVIWMGINVLMIINQWDPYPFILLNFVLSCLAAIQAPIILMSQNRTVERDRNRTERDYYVNRKAEKEINQIQKQLRTIRKLVSKNPKKLPKKR